MRCFVPEAMYDSCRGTLVSQRGSGTINQPESGFLDRGSYRAGNPGLWEDIPRPGT